MDRSFHAMAEMLVGKIFPLPVKGLSCMTWKVCLVPSKVNSKMKKEKA